MYRGKVTAVDAKGVYVQTAEFGLLGPCQAVVANYAVGDMVLCDNVGDDTSPELVVVGRLTAKGNATAGSTTDNAVARFDGTAGALQDSGVTIDDSDNMSGLADVTSAKAAPTWRIAASSGTAAVALDAAAGQSARLTFRTGTSARWIVHRTGTPEGGSNAGSDFVFNRRDDSGGSLGDVLTLLRSSGRVRIGAVGGTAGLEFGSGGPRIMAGTGSPESVVTAPVGSLWLRTNGGAGTTLYVKESGSGNTGWRAV